jgi:hypothetical protein
MYKYRCLVKSNLSYLLKCNDPHSVLQKYVMTLTPSFRNYEFNQILNIFQIMVDSSYVCPHTLYFISTNVGNELKEHVVFFHHLMERRYPFYDYMYEYF